MSLWLRTGLAEPRVALFVGMAYRNLRDPTLDSTKSLILLNILKELRGEFLSFCVPQRFLLRAYPPNVETAALGFPPHPLGVPSEEAGESLARLNLGWGHPLGLYRSRDFKSSRNVRACGKLCCTNDRPPCLHPP